MDLIFCSFSHLRLSVQVFPIRVTPPVGQLLSVAVVPLLPGHLSSSTQCFHPDGPGGSCAGSSNLSSCLTSVWQTRASLVPWTTNPGSSVLVRLGLNGEPGSSCREASGASAGEEGSVQTAGRGSAAWPEGATARGWRRRQRAGVRVKVSGEGEPRTGCAELTRPVGLRDGDGWVTVSPMRDGCAELIVKG